jgi:hypothetical protein
MDKGLLQRFIDGVGALFTLRLHGLSQKGTASFKFETPA